ncbi:methionine aminotransferase [Steroidobacter sp.]|uniref:methionine aminotransferase n=1 Tax=Steroidobacter sp. TaxID=1978227 RepID=UPI001A57A375|nr:methionine aminotransferase [Steroidobacter sp.]MBL8271160.1 aminotransferase class I/II-fold pyridoxal phosphate-dependent enzyme [Steroidobacter sp.]
MNIRSKLPHVGTTIFTVMTNRARELGAINLAQGFPDYDAPAKLKELLAHHVAAGHNQYAPMIGVAELREQIALKLGASYGRVPNVDSEITVTLGATEALFSAIVSLVHPGEEVILFDPSYDSYAPAVIAVGGRPIHIPLDPPNFRIDWDRVRAAISPRTRLVMINTPHNPITTVIPRAELDILAEILRPTDALVISDEVYEHMIYDGARHASIVEHPELYERGVAVFSFGKTMHATGWRVGYAVAPPDITREIRRVHQFNTFSIAQPLQLAIADFLEQTPEHNAGLSAFYQAKRDRFLELLRDSRFTWTPAAGSFFQLLDFSAIAEDSDVDFADKVLRQAGVASIPVSPFYVAPPKLTVLRFCFAKNDATLAAAAEKLCKL